MPQLHRKQAANAFLSLLEEAGRAVADPWFLLPVAASDAVTKAYRERVYCYELYHQIRVLSCQGIGADAGAPAYKLCGEIDKAGLNAVIEGGQQKPDLVWHVPGISNHNAVVVEVKSARGRSVDGVLKDLRNLGEFLDVPERGYERGVLLVFGSRGKHDLRRSVLREADRAALSCDVRKRIHLLCHPEASQPIEDLGSL